MSNKKKSCKGTRSEKARITNMQWPSATSYWCCQKNVPASRRNLPRGVTIQTTCTLAAGLSTLPYERRSLKSILHSEGLLFSSLGALDYCSQGFLHPMIIGAISEIWVIWWQVFLCNSLLSRTGIDANVKGHDTRWKCVQHKFYVIVRMDLNGKRKVRLNPYASIWLLSLSTPFSSKNLSGLKAKGSR